MLGPTAVVGPNPEPVISMISPGEMGPGCRLAKLRTNCVDGVPEPVLAHRDRECHRHEHGRHLQRRCIHGEDGDRGLISPQPEARCIRRERQCRWCGARGRTDGKPGRPGSGSHEVRGGGVDQLNGLRVRRGSPRVCAKAIDVGDATIPAVVETVNVTGTTVGPPPLIVIEPW